MGLWTYPAKPPEEPYAYILDDEGISYNQNSLWPFWTPKSSYNGHKSNPAVIRIAADTHKQAWGLEVNGPDEYNLGIAHYPLSRGAIM